MAPVPPNSRFWRIGRVNPPLGPFFISHSSFIARAILFLRRLDGIHIRSLPTSPRDAFTSSRLQRLGFGLPFSRPPPGFGLERPHDEVLVSRETGRRWQRLFWRRRETARAGSQRGGSGRLRGPYGSWVRCQRTWRELVGRPDGWRCWGRWRGASGDGTIRWEVLPDGFVWIRKGLWWSQQLGR